MNNIRKIFSDITQEAQSIALASFPKESPVTMDDYYRRYVAQSFVLMAHYFLHTQPYSSKLGSKCRLFLENLRLQFEREFEAQINDASDILIDMQSHYQRIRPQVFDFVPGTLLSKLFGLDSA